MPREQCARFGAGSSGLSVRVVARDPGATSKSLPHSQSGGCPLLTYRPLLGPTSQHRWVSHRYIQGVRGNPSGRNNFRSWHATIGCPSRGGAEPVSDWLRSLESCWNATGRPERRPDRWRGGPSASVCVVSRGPGREGAGNWWPRASRLIVPGSECRTPSISSHFFLECSELYPLLLTVWLTSLHPSKPVSGAIFLFPLWICGHRGKIRA